MIVTKLVHKPQPSVGLLLIYFLSSTYHVDSLSIILISS